MQRDGNKCCLATSDIHSEGELEQRSFGGVQQPFRSDLHSSPNRFNQTSTQHQPRMMLHELPKCSLDANFSQPAFPPFMKKPKFSSCVYDQTPPPVSYNSNGWLPDLPADLLQVQGLLPIIPPIRVKSEHYYNPRFYQPRKSIFVVSCSQAVVFAKYCAAIIYVERFWNQLEFFIKTSFGLF